MDHTSNQFWNFSFEVWGNKLAKAGCLRLQHRYAPNIDVDVNLLMFCVWSCCVGQTEMQDRDIDAALKVTKPWRKEVLLPLRTIRQKLEEEGVRMTSKELIQALLRITQKAELEADRIEHVLLGRLLNPLSPKARSMLPNTLDSAAANLTRYLLNIGIIPSKSDKYDLNCLLTAVYEHQHNIEPNNEEPE